MPAQATAPNRPPAPQRLSADSRLTDKQLAFAKLWATGLNSAADCYRKAYKVSSTADWWCRQAAYTLIRKPHVQALVTKLRAEYDTARPALTRAGKREILRDMAIAEKLDPIDRQRAIDIDNKMAGEYQERMHLTADVTVSMFRSAGAIPWQLAENLPKDVTPSRSNGSDAIEVASTNVLQPTLSNGTQSDVITLSPDAPQSHDKAISSSPSSDPVSTPSPPSDRTPARKGKAKLTPLQRAALRKPRGQQR